MNKFAVLKNFVGKDFLVLKKKKAFYVYGGEFLSGKIEKEWRYFHTSTQN